jgi:hypothetical protein
VLIVNVFHGGYGDLVRMLIGELSDFGIAGVGFWQW